MNKKSGLARRRHSGVRSIDRSSSRPDDGNAFFPDNAGTLVPLAEDEAESSAEEFVASALMGESVGEDARDEVVEDEEGGPFFMLSDDGQLPPEATLGLSGEDDDMDLGTGATEQEEDLDSSLQRTDSRRGARWAARGA
jgi:hypothetical protein